MYFKAKKLNEAFAGVKINNFRHEVAPFEALVIDYSEIIKGIVCLFDP